MYKLTFDYSQISLIYKLRSFSSIRFTFLQTDSITFPHIQGELENQNIRSLNLHQSDIDFTDYKDVKKFIMSQFGSSTHTELIWKNYKKEKCFNQVLKNKEIRGQRPGAMGFGAKDYIMFRKQSYAQNYILL
jgi:hypothetical protein